MTDPFVYDCPRCGEEFERVEDCRAHMKRCRRTRIHVVPTADRRWAVVEVP